MLKSFHINIQIHMSDIQRIYIVFGPTQAGKSSFINVLAKQEVAVPGFGSGVSMTKCCTAYIVDIPELGGRVLLIDVPGLDDTNLILTNSKIRDCITASLLEYTSSRSSIDGIICFESVASDSIKVTRTMNELSKFLGTPAWTSVTFLLTKADKLDDSEIRVRSGELQERLENDFTGIKIPWAYWCNKKTGADLQKQKQDLAKCLAKVQPYNLSEINRLRDEILKRAKELQEADKNKRFKDVKLQYEEQKVIEKKEIVKVMKQHIENKEMTRDVTNFDITSRTQKISDGGLFGTGLFAKKYEIPIYDIKPVTTKETYLMPEVVEKEVEEEKVKYDIKTEQKEKTEKVAQDPYDINYYIKKAKEEKLKEIREKIMSCKK